MLAFCCAVEVVDVPSGQETPQDDSSAETQESSPPPAADEDSSNTEPVPEEQEPLQLAG